MRQRVIKRLQQIGRTQIHGHVMDNAQSESNHELVIVTGYLLIYFEACTANEDLLRC